MLSIVEMITIHTFFILQFLLDIYQFWLIQMDNLINATKDKTEIPLWGLPNNNTTLIKESIEEVYENSLIEKEQLDFANKLVSHLNSADCSEPEHPSSINTHKMEFPAAGKKEETIIKATAHIKDFKIGSQFWIVEVVGEEQGYIHVSDGTARTWVKADTFGHFYKRDILFLHVNREGEHIHLKEVTILQRKSNDFLIYDEEEIELVEYQEVITA